jgi:hypothetical protein
MKVKVCKIEAIVIEANIQLIDAYKNVIKTLNDFWLKDKQSLLLSRGKVPICNL